MAERIAKNRGHHARRRRRPRPRVAAPAKRSAQSEGRFDREILPIEAPVLGEDGKPTGATRVVTRPGPARDDQGGPRRAEADLPGGIHTAGNSSQVSDGAGAVLWMTPEEGRSPRPQAARAHRLPTASSAPIPTTCSTARSTRPNALRRRPA
jgi:acetyl-CoA C-acetyltransferase